MTTVGGKKCHARGLARKKSRGKARKAATPRDPTPPAPANAFAALAAPEEEEPSDGEEEEPEPEQEEQDAEALMELSSPPTPRRLVLLTVEPRKGARV